MFSILFFDNKCLFCKSLVYLFSQLLKNTSVHFAPLDGSTAHMHIKVKKSDSIVFLDAKDKKMYRKSKGIFYMLSYLHPWFKYFSYASFFFDPMYSIVAKLRKFIPTKSIELKGEKFLS